MSGRLGFDWRKGKSTTGPNLSNLSLYSTQSFLVGSPFMNPLNSSDLVAFKTNQPLPSGTVQGIIQFVTMIPISELVPLSEKDHLRRLERTGQAGALEVDPVEMEEKEETMSPASRSVIDEEGSLSGDVALRRRERSRSRPGRSRSAARARGRGDGRPRRERSSPEQRGRKRAREEKDEDEKK